MRITPGDRNAPYRTVAGGTTRTPASTNPCFSGQLVVVLERSELHRLHPADPEVEQHRLLGPLVHAQAAPSVGSATRTSPRSSSPIGVLDRLASIGAVARRRSSPRSERPAPRDVDVTRAPPDRRGLLRGRPPRARSPRASAPWPCARSPRPRVRRTTRARRRCRTVEQLQRPRQRRASAGDARPTGRTSRRSPRRRRRAPRTAPGRRRRLAAYRARCSRRVRSSPQAATRRALDELLRRHAAAGAERLQRRDQLRVAGHEAGAVARHDGALAEAC